MIGIITQIKDKIKKTNNLKEKGVYENKKKEKDKK